MSSDSKVLALFIGRRYASVKTSRLLVNFISRLSIIGLALGVAILVAVLSVMNGFDRELREKILSLLPHITVSTFQNYSLDSESQWQDVIARVENIPGVIGAVPQVEVQGMVIANGVSKGVALSGIRPELEQKVSIIDNFMVSGSLANLEAGEYQILIGQSLAEELRVAVGDTINLVSTEVPVNILGGFPRRKNFTVVGIFNVGSQLDSSFAYIHLEDAQTLYRLANKIHGIRVQVDDLFAVERFGNEMRDVVPVNARIRYWTYDFGNIYENIRLSKNMVGLLLFLLVAVAAFNVVVSLFMIVRDKQGDIAILRTMGTSTSSIRNIFIVHGLFIGLSGTVAGLILGLLLTFLLTPFVAWLESSFGLQFLSADIYPVNYLPTQILVSDVFVVCAVALLLSVLATLYPAFSAAKVKPAETLRFE